MVDLVLDAVGEYVDFIGQVYWDGAPGSAKTISNTAGKISLRFGAVTFSNPSTNIRIGIQDLDTTTSAPGRGDGIYDVQSDLVGGTDTITANTGRQTAVETGTKNITHGQLIAIRVEMTARGGTDSVAVSAYDTNAGQSYPAVTFNSGSPTTSGTLPIALLESDDGTIGWIQGTRFIDNITLRTFDSGTAGADEYASLFQSPYQWHVIGICFRGRFAVASGIATAILYSDPLGSPVAERQRAIDTDQVGGNSSASNALQEIFFTTSYVLTPNTKIALALQPQSTTGDVAVYELGLGTTINGRSTPFGGGEFDFQWSKGTRLDGSGAFTESTNDIMLIGPILAGITQPAAATTIINVME